MPTARNKSINVGIAVSVNYFMHAFCVPLYCQLSLMQYAVLFRNEYIAGNQTINWGMDSSHASQFNVSIKENRKTIIHISLFSIFMGKIMGVIKHVYVQVIKFKRTGVRLGMSYHTGTVWSSSTLQCSTRHKPYGVRAGPRSPQPIWNKRQDSQSSRAEGIAAISS